SSTRGPRRRPRTASSHSPADAARPDRPPRSGGSLRVETGVRACSGPTGFYKTPQMLLRPVEYARPESLEDALRLLAANDGARALAGGQTLVNVMKARAASPDVLVDLA